jgi:ribonuclease D
MSAAESRVDAGSASPLPVLAARARAAGRLALDTEFMGEGRYRTLLCLIQLAVGDGDGHRHIEIVDPLAEDLDGAPLAEVLADPAIEIVLHAGRQDIALVRRRLGTEVSNILDTQIAAGFAGLPAQASYDSLLSELLGVRLSKSASFTRWDVRPLSDEQVAYAREDVVHLLDLATELERRLAARGRLEWAREECRSLQVASDERDVDAIFARLPRVRGLRPESQAIARELVEWREQTAAGQDRPVQTVLNDAGLIEVAKRRPGSIRELSQIRGVNQGSLRRLGDSLLTAVERGRSRELPASDEDRRPPTPDGDDAPLIALCESLVRARARAEGLAYELVAARADLQAIITAWRAGAAEPAVRTLHGWRRELVGEELLALLDGRISLSVDSRRRLRIASG